MILLFWCEERRAFLTDWVLPFPHLGGWTGSCSSPGRVAPSPSLTSLAGRQYRYPPCRPGINYIEGTGHRIGTTQPTDNRKRLDKPWHSLPPHPTKGQNWRSITRNPGSGRRRVECPPFSIPEKEYHSKENACFSVLRKEGILHRLGYSQALSIRRKAGLTRWF